MNKIKQIEINFGAVTQNTTETSDAIDLALYDNMHLFSAQLLIAASAAPEIDIDYQVSNDGVNYVSGGTLIFDGSVKGDSPLVPTAFTPPLARWLKITCTEMNAGAATSVRVILCIQ